MQRLYGLSAYLPYVLPAEKPAGLPDEVALVFYESQASYVGAKDCAGGRAYSDLHGVVFEHGDSDFPQFAADSIQIGTPYHVFESAIDWQTVSATVWVGQRCEGIDQKEYAARLSKALKSLQSQPGLVTGAVLFAAPDWLLYWQCSELPILDRQFRFADAAKPVFSAEAERIAIPPLLTDKIDQVPVKGGDFYNTQFPRCEWHM